MTQNQLDELRNKFINKQGDVNDLGEILCELYTSVSGRCKGIKSNQEAIYLDIKQIKASLNPVYTIIHSDEFEDEDGPFDSESIDEE